MPSLSKLLDYGVFVGCDEYDNELWELDGELFTVINDPDYGQVITLAE